MANARQGKVIAPARAPQRCTAVASSSSLVGNVLKMNSGPFLSWMASRMGAYLPLREVQLLLHFVHGLLPHCLAHGQGHHGRGIGKVLAEDEYSVRMFLLHAVKACARGLLQYFQGKGSVIVIRVGLCRDKNAPRPPARFNAKVVSRLARGEPMPITLLFFSSAATCSIICSRWIVPLECGLTAGS